MLTEKAAPGPVLALSKGAADDGPEHACDAPDEPEHALVGTTLCERDEVGQDDLCEREDAARASALDCAAGDEHAHALSGAAESAAEREEEEKYEENGTTTEYVCEVATERQKGCSSERIRASDPDELHSERVNDFSRGIRVRRPTSFPWKSAMMVGSAVETADVSSAARKVATMSATMVSQNAAVFAAPSAATGALSTAVAASSGPSDDMVRVRIRWGPVDRS